MSSDGKERDLGIRLCTMEPTVALGYQGVPEDSIWRAIYNVHQGNHSTNQIAVNSLFDSEISFIFQLSIFELW